MIVADGGTPTLATAYTFSLTRVRTLSLNGERGYTVALTKKLPELELKLELELELELELKLELELELKLELELELD